MGRYLTKHPNHQLVEFLLQGLSEEFCIGFDYASPITLKSAKTNMQSAFLYAKVVGDYLQTEISLGRVAGPFYLKPYKVVTLAGLESSLRTINQTNGG